MHVSTPGNLGIFVRDRRKQLGWTQARLAASAGVSLRWLSAFERGKPAAELSLVFQILHALGLIVDIRPEADAISDVDLDELLRGLDSTDE